MPQMSPLLWTNLYMYITIIFIMILIMNFYNKPPIKMSSSIFIKKFSKLSWKW